ncbi:28S ribosomal protein S31, mitochondrial isoform X2 [Phyllopteryx taeniolatus]|uniref:28S ribosomal protein S31, mitochondrial isoform X2 n=1 Tax=Phyllopteryx taeniolatus TaxID=161469 RepID=UPI002AD27727|nr:28S ribosomal protein S31, mitochondrial isoform X2 [Phyllopteryx taeniolatus]
MFRFISHTLHAAQKTSVNISGSRIFPTDYDTATVSILRVSSACTAKYLSTSPARFCENTQNSTNAVIVADSTEPRTERQQQTRDSSDVDKLDEPYHGDNIKKMDGAQGKEVAPVAAKSGKESLLDLLGAMKVDVTSKRRLKNVNVKQSVSQPKSTPVAMESTISMFQKASREASSRTHTLDPELLAAACAAASTLPNRVQAESELLKQLRRHEAITEAHRKGDVNNLGVILADMKVGRYSNRQNARPANQIRFDDDGRGYTQERGITAELDSVRRKRNLFTGRRLNIFSSTPDEDRMDATFARPTLWDADFANQLSSSANQMPRNAFEEMIQWTKEGKLWQYPIDNEAGLEEEAGVPFHEHVFLEKHLEAGFPEQGPIRHFMELVATGLSRNPYLTVQQKKEHISWFRDYFNQKHDVLKEAEVYLH